MEPSDAYSICINYVLGYVLSNEFCVQFPEACSLFSLNQNTFKNNQPICTTYNILTNKNYLASLLNDIEPSAKIYLFTCYLLIIKSKPMCKLQWYYLQQQLSPICFSVSSCSKYNPVSLSIYFSCYYGNYLSNGEYKPFPTG